MEVKNRISVRTVFNMGKEQYFIITAFLVGIVTVFPIDGAMFVDSSQLSAAGSSNFASKLPSQSTCGIRKAPSFRIVGGSDSQLGAWPWMVALGYKHTTDTENDSIKWLCGGTLISNTHVLTACTCVTSIGSRLLILARVGDLNLDPTIDDGATPLDIPIKRIIRHKEYDAQKVTNDIALLVLKNIVSFTALIQPICLPQLPNIKNMDMRNSFSFIAGWGVYMFRGPSGTSLKEVQVPIINLTDCINAYKKRRYVIDDRMICAGEEGKDACSGDSGGPLMWFKEKQFYLMGIVSYGFKCGEPNSPGVYTRVPYYLDWILERINS